MAAALHVKLTALLVVPALLSLWLGTYGWRQALRLGAVWGPVLLGAWTALGVLSPSFSLEHLLLQHLKASMQIPAEAKAILHPLAASWWEPSRDLAALLSLPFWWRRRKKPIALFTFGWTAAAGAFALCVRPWWSYYALHWHIPLAIAAARGTVGSVRYLLYLRR